MGMVSTQGETAFRQTPEQLYEFVTNPENWPLTYPGSTGVNGTENGLKLGDVWEETSKLEGVDARYDWRVLIANPPRQWAFQSVGRISQHADGTGGFDGVLTVTYTFVPIEQGWTLFRRNLVCEVPRGERIPAEIQLAFEPFYIDEYHAAVARHLPALHEPTG